MAVDLKLFCGNGRVLCAFLEKSKATFFYVREKGNGYLEL